MNNDASNTTNQKLHKSCLEISFEHYTEHDYSTISWPAIEQVLYTFLNHKPGQYVPIRYEEIYW